MIVPRMIMVNGPVLIFPWNVAHALKKIVVLLAGNQITDADTGFGGLTIDRNGSLGTASPARTR